jgi:hypothetical protein
MSQGSRTRNTPINLDQDLLGQRLAKPQTVVLAGREWSVRRDLTGAEVFEFWRLFTASDTAAVLGLLVGAEEGKELAELLETLPVNRFLHVLSRLMDIAGIKRMDEPEESMGESTASSPGS